MLKRDLEAACQQFISGNLSNQELIDRVNEVASKTREIIDYQVELVELTKDRRPHAFDEQSTHYILGTKKVTKIKEVCVKVTPNIDDDSFWEHIDTLIDRGEIDRDTTAEEFKQYIKGYYQ